MSKSYTHNPKGFTLGELLAVIAIICILLGLLFPFLLQKRTEARRITCSNNMRQIGLALYNHDAASGEFPPGITIPTGSSPPVTESVWAASAWLLPYLEISCTFDVLAPTPETFLTAATPGTQNFLTAPTSHMSVFRCPSDSGTDLNTARPGLIPNRDTAKSNFVFANNASPITSDANGNLSATDEADCNSSDDIANGLFCDTSRGLSSMENDGTTNTIIVSERRTSSKNQKVTQPSAGLLFGARGSDISTSGNEVSNGIADVCFSTIGGINTVDPARDASQGISSNHPRGVNIVLGDASTQFLTNQVDRVVYNQLVNFHDQPVLENVISN